MKLAPHKPIREKYNPTPSAKEKRFHLWVMDQPCEACGAHPCGVAHHLLTETPEKRWRRDHEMVLPLCDGCHRSLHASGDEWSWCMSYGFSPIDYAVEWRDMGRKKGLI